MSTAPRYRLADSTLVEPLVQSWPAWSYLLPPLPAALHASAYQIKTLESYLEDPAMHEKASRDPALFGGPWVDVAMARQAEVRELLETMTSTRAEALTFARAFMDFHRRLASEAAGQSLEGFYPEIPDPVRGYVELVYDYYHRPFVRVHEDLLYRSRHYDEGTQSLRLSTLQSDQRPFFMSTPSLAADADVSWTIPFRDPRVDELYRLDVTRRPLGEILDLLGLDERSSQRVRALLTDAPARVGDRWTEERVRIRLVGHACVLIEWKGIAILTDPFVPVQPAEVGTTRISYRDLPERIDFAIITHNHQDHFALETLLRLRHRIDCLVVPRPYRLLYGDLSLKRLATTIGFRHVVELDELETITFGDGGITAVPFHGEHADLAHGKNGYVVRCGTAAVWFGADSDCLDADLYRNTARLVGPIDALFLGTESVGGPLSWTNGPLLPAPPRPEHEAGRRYHGCCARTALELLEAVGAPRIYVYAMGLEPWMDHLLGLGMNDEAPQWIESERLLSSARERGYIAERLKGPCEVVLTREERPYAAVTAVRADRTAEERQFEW